MPVVDCGPQCHTWPSAESEREVAQRAAHVVALGHGPRERCALPKMYVGTSPLQLRLNLEGPELP